MSFYTRSGKRLLDLLMTIPLAIVLSPLVAVVAIMVRIKLGAPLLFRHERPGLDGRPFIMLKFRTMTEARDPSGHLRPDAERITSFGRFLRASSLDELPELFNVLKGDMSLVGPRPLLMQYIERYTPEQMRRQNVRPGVTGWAQVNGRNAISWEEKFALDCWYIDNISLRLDLLILLRTIGQVIRRESISQEGHATMSEFLGTPHPPEGRS
jgi:sugar transferase EpsL